MLYDTLDNSPLFRCHAEKGSRSGMNVTFRTTKRLRFGRGRGEAVRLY